MRRPGFLHILVPLDGSPSSELAIPAAERAAAESATLTLVRIAEDIVSDHHLPDGSDKETFWQKQARPVREYLESAPQLVSRADLKVQTIVASGHPAEAILDLAAKLEVEAVAMASHSRSKLRQVLIGSTVQTVMARLPVPLLIVHPTSEQLQDWDG